MKKKILATLMAAVLASTGLMLTACGSKATEADAESSAPEESSGTAEENAPAEDAAVKGDGELSFCTIISNSSDYCKAEQAGAEALAAELGIEHMTLNANSNAQT